MPQRSMMKILSISTISATQLEQLSALLINCVDGGASIGFWPPLSMAQAQGYWQGVASELGQRRFLLAACEGEQILGAVQLALCPKQNGSHRADVEKLMVHTHQRGAGWGRALLQAAEDLAGQQQRSLLVLDTRSGDPASHLYRSAGWVEAGQIPGFASNPDGSRDPTTIFYKQLSP